MGVPDGVCRWKTAVSFVAFQPGRKTAPEDLRNRSSCRSFSAIRLYELFLLLIVQREKISKPSVEVICSFAVSFVHVLCGQAENGKQGEARRLSELITSLPFAKSRDVLGEDCRRTLPELEGCEYSRLEPTRWIHAFGVCKIADDVESRVLEIKAGGNALLVVVVDGDCDRRIPLEICRPFRCH